MISYLNVCQVSGWEILFYWSLSVHFLDYDLQEDISHALVNCSWDLPVIRLVWLCFHQCVQFLHIFYILMNLQCVSYKIYFLILIKLTCLIYKSRESIVLWLHCNGFLTPLLALPPCFPLVIKWLFLSCYKDNFFPT